MYNTEKNSVLGSIEGVLGDYKIYSDDLKCLDIKHTQQELNDEVCSLLIYEIIMFLIGNQCLFNSINEQ